MKNLIFALSLVTLFSSCTAVYTTQTKTYTGSKGGQYHYSASGKKVYAKKK